jgi:hypothetical protein
MKTRKVARKAYDQHQQAVKQAMRFYRDAGYQVWPTNADLAREEQLAEARIRGLLGLLPEADRETVQAAIPGHKNAAKVQAVVDALGTGLYQV